MKAIMVMFDSLNRRMLSPYGCNWVQTPNFARLSRQSVTFDGCFVGSMPCMPARREIHTGRYNFLHRSWGPLEPFDDSMPEILKTNGIHTHLISDHYHYWEDGGCTYHTKYKTWEIARGQEGDPWKANLNHRDFSVNPDRADSQWGRQDNVNRSYQRNEEDQSIAQVFRMGEEFLRTNHDADNWFLTLEAFDPHEPYFSPQKYRDLYPHDYDGPESDWPWYKRVEEPEEVVRHMRCVSAALHTMCDAYLGKILDAMDKLNLWEDTLLIVNTDHGFLLGEHGWWAKCCQPFYNEVAHTPLFVWDPRLGSRGERCDQLVQTIDLPATLLEYFGVDRPADMQGVPLRDTMATGEPVRQAALFGLHGGHVNCTDGRYVYMRAPVSPDNAPLHEYTLMPAGMRHTFDVSRLQSPDLAEPFGSTKGCPTLRLPARSALDAHSFGTMLFDLETDPNQERPIDEPAAQARMEKLMVRLMKENDAPVEQYERLGLT